MLVRGKRVINALCGPQQSFKAELLGYFVWQIEDVLQMAPVARLCSNACLSVLHV